MALDGPIVTAPAGFVLPHVAPSAVKVLILYQ
jgi:hypothetical protein